MPDHARHEVNVGLDEPQELRILIDDTRDRDGRVGYLWRGLLPLRRPPRPQPGGPGRGTRDQDDRAQWHEEQSEQHGQGTVRGGVGHGRVLRRVQEEPRTIHQKAPTCGQETLKASRMIS